MYSGIRELDPHLEILQGLGAEIIDGEKLSINTSNGLKATTLWQDYMSVTTTENFAMAASVRQMVHP